MTLSHGLWAETAPQAPKTPTLDGVARADVAIVGAGYCGLSAALELAELGVKAAVVEARDIGFGGSGRNVGLVNAGMWVMPDKLIETLGPIHGERLIRLLGDAPSAVFARVDRFDIRCELRREGTLHCAPDAAGEAELRARQEQWQARQAPVELLTGVAAAKAVGSPYYRAALLDRRAGTLQPLAYVRGLAQAALSVGARIFTNTPVEGLSREGAGWRLQTPGGALIADKVILATDAYSEGPFAALRQAQLHLPYFNIATVPLTPEQRTLILPGGQGAWDTCDVLSSFRLDGAGRLVMGSVGALNGLGLGVHHAWAGRAIARIFPELAGIGLDQAWYGQIGMTDTNLPRLHQWDEGVFAINGYNGRGIAPGTVMGRELARLVAGDIRPADFVLPFTPVEPARLRIAKESFYEVGAAFLHLIEHRL